MTAGGPPGAGRGYHPWMAIAPPIADPSTTIELLGLAAQVEHTQFTRLAAYSRVAPGTAQRMALARCAAQRLDACERLLTRITELGGRPNMSPEGLATRSHAEYREGTDLQDMIKEDLIAERIAIETYNEIARWLGDADISSRRMIEEILAKEEEHADDLAKLLVRIGGSAHSQAH